MQQAIMNWSGGKDSALTLYKILNIKKYNIQYLLSSFSQEFDRVSMHGVRSELMQKQSESIGIELKKIMIPTTTAMDEYNKIMHTTMQKFKQEGITHAIFGDIFLKDLRLYREQQLAKVNIEAVFPIWEIDTKQLIKEFLGLGFKTMIVCVSDKFLDSSFVGRIIDEKFINDLPSNVDPCGENGEFHTFVFDGPIFKNPVSITKGEIVYKQYQAPSNDSDKKTYNQGFWYLDLL